MKFQMKTVRQCFPLELFVCHTNIIVLTVLLYKRLTAIFLNVNNLQVIIGVPNALQRLSILESHTASLRIAQGVDLAHIAELTIGYVGADIASLCREAAFISLKRTLGCSYNKGLDISSEWANVEGNQKIVCIGNSMI